MLFDNFRSVLMEKVEIGGSLMRGEAGSGKLERGGPSAARDFNPLFKSPFFTSTLRKGTRFERFKKALRRTGILLIENIDITALFSSALPNKVRRNTQFYDRSLLGPLSFHQAQNLEDPK